MKSSFANSHENKVKVDAAEKMGGKSEVSAREVSDQSNQLNASCDMKPNLKILSKRKIVEN